MSSPHIYSSYEIYLACQGYQNTNKQLADTQFVMLKDYDEVVEQKNDDQNFNFIQFYEEREDNRALRQRVDQLERDNADLVEQLRKAIQDQIFWIPCSLRLPKRGEYVIVRGSQGEEVRCWDTIHENDDYDGHDISYEAWFKEYEVEHDPYYWIEFEEVTHWMPMPKDIDESKEHKEIQDG